MSESDILRLLWAKKYEAAIALVLCLMVATISNPQGAINQFMIHCIDVIFELWPETPSHLKIASILSKFAAKVPSVGWGILWETIQGLLGILTLVLFVKLYKLLPFT